jgi:hypothetical protein
MIVERTLFTISPCFSGSKGLMNAIVAVVPLLIFGRLPCRGLLGFRFA